MLRRILYGFLVAAALCNPAYSEVAKTLAGEQYQYQNIFKGTIVGQHLQVAKKLELAGLSGTALFDLIEARLLESYKKKVDKETIDYLSWLSKALAFSGQAKYLPTLDKVAQAGESKKLRKYATISIDMLPDYEKWNGIIAGKDHWNKKKNIVFNRYANCVRSDDLRLKRLAAKKVYSDRYYDNDLLKLMAQELEQNYLKDSGDKLFVDTYAWMGKAIAGSKNEKYKPLIEKVAREATNSKLQKYAKKYLGYYNKS